MTTFKELLKLNDDGKKTIVVGIGLGIIVGIHMFYLLIAYWALQYSTWDAFVLTVILMGLGDFVGITIWIVKAIFKVSSQDMEKIKTDDIPTPTSSGE